MYNFEKQGGEAKAVGWISMADLFMLCSIVMLAVAVGFAMSLKKSDVMRASVEGEYASFKNSSTMTLNDLNTKVTQLSADSAAFQAQSIELDKQLKNVRAQLANSEAQLVLFKDSSAKFKSQSENLAGELNVQVLKLNSVQSEFDKYKNINTLTQGEMKTELVRLSKEIGDYKLTLAELQTQLRAWETKYAESERQIASLKLERDKYKSESELRVVELDKQKSIFEARLAKIGGDLTQANADLTKVNGEKDQLLADLLSRKNALTALENENNDMRIKMNIVDADKKRLNAKLAELEGTIVGLNSEIGVLQPQIAKLKVDLTGAKLRIIDLEKAVFETINRAKLVITITAQDVPKDFTLELFVTDPLGNDCGPFSSVIFNEGDEIGVLQQSVDFKSGREGSQKAVFYSLRPIFSQNDGSRTYTVKAMIRHNGNDDSVKLPQKVSVNCSIDLPNASGPDAHKVATREIDVAGYIRKVKRGGSLTSGTPYKNMWPWEPVYHFERLVCDFNIDGNKITNLRTFENIATAPPGSVSTQPSSSRGSEQLIDSIRNRTGN